MAKQLTCVILAAGKGTRLKRKDAKPLLPLLGKSLIDYVLLPVNQLSCSVDFSVIVGHQKEQIKNYLNEKNNFEFIDQDQQLGTGHALQEFAKQTQLSNENILVLCADTPLINQDILENFISDFEESNVQASVLGFNARNPFGYGRIKTFNNGVSIIEEKEASSEEKKINLVNSGIYLFKKSFLVENLSKLSNENNSGELYLTDLFQENLPVKTFSSNENEKIFMGINDLVQLSEATQIIQQSIIEKHQRNGVIFKSPSSNIIESDVTIEPDSIIGANVELYGQTIINEEVSIDAGSIITDSTINANTHIKPYSVIESSEIGSHCQIGPFARIRPKSNIGENSKIGNFVETKKVNLSSNVKVSHLSYVGDAEVGENTNIGCGFITCNYDGKNKHVTTIGKNCFIGSDSQTIAPINIGDSCFVASGTTVNKDMPDNSFGVSRGRLEVKEGIASRFIKK